jgi:hypothetical protein
MAAELNNYQYYGLVGQSITTAGSSLIEGFGEAAAQTILAGGYGMSAEMMDVQAEQELLNAEIAADARLEQYNQTEAANAAMLSAMGKTAENLTISEASRETVRRDVSLMRSGAKMRNIAARSKASALRSQQKQSEIMAKNAMVQSVTGAVGSLAMAYGTYGMIGGGTGGGTGGTGTQVG